VGWRRRTSWILTHEVEGVEKHHGSGKGLLVNREVLVELEHRGAHLVPREDLEGDVGAGGILPDDRALPFDAECCLDLSDNIQGGRGGE